MEKALDRDRIKWAWWKDYIALQNQDPQISPILHCQQSAYEPTAKYLCFVLFWNWVLNDYRHYQSLSSGIHRAAGWPTNTVRKKMFRRTFSSIRKWIDSIQAIESGKLWMKIKIWGCLFYHKQTNNLLNSRTTKLWPFWLFSFTAICKELPKK